MGELAGLREYSSMCYCLNEIPLRVRRGLSLVEVQFTCVDAVEEFIAVGTNIGVVYWCNRRTSKIERLRPEQWEAPITSVKVVSSVDYMVAAGDSKGKISVFIIPKEKPVFLPADHEKEKRAIERFTASDIHQSPITAIEWSINGQKLFTGDEKGLVAYTQMDFHLNITKSMEILNEKFCIVQLSYSQPQILVVASEYRCIVYNQSKDSKINQVGQKDRISLCKLGAVIGSHSSLPGPVIFSARPKQRIWLSDTTGQVHRTLLFKEALSLNYPDIKVLHPYNSTDNALQNSSRSSSVDSLSSTGACSDIDFSYLRVYKGKFLLAYGSSCLVFLNVEDTSVAAALAIRKIQSVAVNRDEVFVLESHRRVRRLAVSTDPYSSMKSYNANTPEAPIGGMLVGIFKKIKEEASANVVQPLIEKVKKVESAYESEILSPAEDALLFFDEKDKPELAIQQPIPSNETDSVVYDDDIVYREKKKSSASGKEKGKRIGYRVAKTRSSDKIPDNFSAREVGSDTTNISTERSIAGIENENHTKDETEYDNFQSQKNRDDIHQLSTRPKNLIFDQIPADIKPDLRTPNSIEQSLQLNEKILAWRLNHEMKVSPAKALTTISEVVPSTDSNSFLSVNSVEKVTENERSSSVLPCAKPEASEPVFEPGPLQPFPSFLEPMLEQELLQFPTAVPNMLEPELSQPSHAVLGAPELNSAYKDILKTQDELSGIDAALVHSYCDHVWKRTKVSFLPLWISVADIGVFCGTNNLQVFRSATKMPQFQWTKEEYRTLKMSISQSGCIWWKLDLGVASARVTEKNSSQWKVTVRNVESIAVNETSAWYVCDGRVHVQNDLTPEKPYNEESIKIDCTFTASKLFCFGHALWVLSTKGHIWNRMQITDENPFGTEWKKIIFPDSITIADIALTCRSSGWIIDKFNNVYFSDNYSSENPDWWQVIIDRCIRKSDASLSDQLSRFVYRSKDRPAAIGSDQSSIWLSLGIDNSIYINRSAVLGHQWIPISVEGLTSKTKWKFLATADNLENTSDLWCMNSNNDLFLFRPTYNTIRAIAAPPTDDSYDIVCLTAVPGSLWMLTNDGKIVVRTGINELTPFGYSWQELHLRSANNTVLSFKQLSLGPNIVWAINANDDVYAAVCDLGNLESDSVMLDWRLIENPVPANTKLIDVIVGPNKYMVWALDSKCNVYVREGVFDDIPFGIGWVKVSGIRAVQLTISSFAVWALTAEGYIYRRAGISSENYIGDYWSQIPGSFSLITASISENVWGVSKVTGRLQMYKNHILSLHEDFIRNRKFSENIEDSWEIVES